MGCCSFRNAQKDRQSKSKCIREAVLGWECSFAAWGLGFRVSSHRSEAVVVLDWTYGKGERIMSREIVSHDDGPSIEDKVCYDGTYGGYRNNCLVEWVGTE